MNADKTGPGKGTGRNVAGQSGAKRAKPPVTIDLPAEEIRSAPEAVEPAPEPPRATEEPAPPRAEPTEAATPPHPDERQSRWPHFLAAGLAGGLIVLGLGFGLQAAGLLPAPGRMAANEAKAAADRTATSLSALDQRVTAIESASAQTIADRALLDDLARRVGVADAFGSSLGDRILTLEASAAALEEKTVAMEAVTERVDALSDRVRLLEEARTATPIAPEGGDVSPARTEPPVATLDRDRLSTIETRIEALTADAASLAERMARLESDIRPGNASSAEIPEQEPFAALRATSAQGGAFAVDRGALESAGISAATISSLVSLAQKGAPTRAELTAAFPDVADAILTAPATGEQGILGRILSYGESLVRIRPAEPVDGTNAAAIVSRMEAAVDAGDFDTALSEREALPADGRDVSQAWADQVSARLAIDRTIDGIAASATTPVNGG